MNRLGKLTLAGVASVAGVAGAALFAAAPAQAQVNISANIPQSCVPLQVVGGEGTRISKSVSLPSFGFTKNNWNTDFIVPAGQNFTRFLGEVRSESQGRYAVEMNLKYSDRSADEVFDDSIRLDNTVPLVIEGVSTQGKNPYQVNLEVGGVRAIGEDYTIAAYGCY